MDPPICKKVPHVHKYHDLEFNDSYHWLKDMNPKEKRPDIIEYIKAENKYFDSHRDQELSDTIYNEIISRIQEDDEQVPTFKDPYYYYSRTVKGQQYPIYCRKLHTLDSPEEIVLNQNEMKQEYQDLSYYRISPNHKILAYSMDFDGSENYKIFFKDLTTGQLIESETIEKSAGSIEWAQDSQTVFYNTLDDIHRPDKIYRHEFGVADDVLIYHEPDPKFVVGFEKSLSNKYIFIGSFSKLTNEYHYIDANFPKTDPILFNKRENRHRYSVEHQGDRFLILTDLGGKCLNNTLYSCPINATSIQHWEEVIPYDHFTYIEEILPFEKHIALFERSNGNTKLRIVKSESGKVKNYEEASHYIDFDEEVFTLGTISASKLNYHGNKLIFVYDSMVTASQTIEYDMTTKERKYLKKTNIPGNFDPKLYTMKRIYAPIDLSTKVNAPFDTPVPDNIPISLIYKTDLFKGDGTNPLYLYGYGSYGISIEPSWSSSRISLLDRGFVYAIAHIRGGGDCGRAWYETGKFKHKRNTFIDFITCAKHLIHEKYTSSSVLAIDGRSAGGMLIGAVLNMEPKLCAVAVAGVPFVDVINTMMDPTIPLTINEYEEWGNPNEKDYFDYMLSYSPYDNIPQGAKFPNLLIKAGLFDPRVAYWEPSKWIAKLRDMKMDGGENDAEKSILCLDCKMGSGHFGSTGRYSYIKEIANDYTFVLTQMNKIQLKLKGSRL
ncbi:oligopeptidase B [Globomyces pollinis-pini]|nr:oligopeptidase B [Globomyces pollinis-pini]